MRGAILLRSLLLLSSSLSTLTKACGVLVHNEVLRRAQFLYSLPSTSNAAAEESVRELFSQYMNAPESVPVTQAGAFFPDWGYHCLWSDQDAEAAHWPPFQRAWADYVTGKYGLQGSEPLRVLDDDEKAHLRTLISFGFALSSHQTADETWRSIRLASSFLKNVAMNDFSYNLKDAHDTIELGGDVLFATRFTVPNGASWVSSSWSVPIADIIAVYARMGRSVSAAKLQSCAVRGLAVLKTELSLASKWYKSYAEKSPTMVTEIDGYYLGGVEEMASSTAYCWANLTRWYVHGTPAAEGAEWGLCDVFRARIGWSRTGEAHDSHIGLRDVPGFAAALEAAERRVELRSSNKFGVMTYEYRDALSDSALLRKEYLPSSDPTVPKFADPTYISTYVPYAQFGHAFSVGAIGPSLADPAPHIAITAPLETEDSFHPNAGSVYILPLSQLDGKTTQSKTHLTPLDKSRPLHRRQAPSRDEQATSNVRFGHSMTTWSPLPDNNHSFLAIASPGPQTFDLALPYDQHPAGKIDIFYGANKIQTWFGFGAPLGGRGAKLWGEVLTSGKLTEEAGEELVIGSPMSDAEESPPPGKCPWGFFYAQRGFVQVAKFPGVGAIGNIKKQPVEVLVQSDEGTAQPMMWTIFPPPRPAGEDPCAQLPPPRFGSALVVTPVSGTLLIGAPGQNMVYAYRYDKSLMDFGLTFTIPLPAGSESEGKSKRIDFGKAIAVGITPHGEEWIAISAPGERGGRGVVRVYILGGGRRSGVRLVAEVGDEEEEKFARFGRILAPAAGGRKGLFVGSGFAAEERGAVWWVDVDEILLYAPHTSDGDLLRKRKRNQVVLGEGRREVWEVKAKRVLIGPEDQKARFGEAVVWGDIGGDGRGDLVVGLPFAGTGEVVGKRLTGAIAVFLGE
ncbi:hypothetical protein L211DRAFT_421083 [Terfezia boudieri ATCC MYA-4762]|uniref:Uncharacterized protein n=1 Tax=Terfezia boudieri ATCC MYA-4762 TaxID=1051890 RepID=A0A3N4LF95_9PEZI|nr:hypothetical protein L211DRAFT_421083 [Terfezia boudieri ATCC MYA-4762]